MPADILHPCLLMLFISFPSTCLGHTAGYPGSPDARPGRESCLPLVVSSGNHSGRLAPLSLGVRASLVLPRCEAACLLASRELGCGAPPWPFLRYCRPKRTRRTPKSRGSEEEENENTCRRDGRLLSCRCCRERRSKRSGESQAAAVWSSKPSVCGLPPPAPPAPIRDDPGAMCWRMPPLSWP